MHAANTVSSSLFCALVSKAFVSFAAETEVHGLCLAMEDMPNLGKQNATVACEALAWLRVLPKRRSSQGSIAVCSQSAPGWQTEVVKHENKGQQVCQL